MVTRALLVAPVLVSALALAGGCSIDDRVLTETDGEAGDGAGGSSGGSGGKGGSGGSSGGSGGTGGGGTSGTGGYVDCDGDRVAVDMDVVKACILHTSCHPYLPSNSISQCVTYQTLRAFPQGDCGTGSDDCADFRACAGYGYYDGDGCESGVDALCEGNTGVRCSAEFSVEFDCDPGTTCEVLTGGAVGCLMPETCTEEDGTSRCDGNIHYSCQGGMRYGGDCSVSGAMCRLDDVTGSTACYYVAPTCNNPDTVECGASGRIDLCTTTGTSVHYQCAPGLGCSVEGESGAWCLAPGCTPETPCSESCDGTELTICYGSIPVTVDCRDYGLTRCIESTLSDDSGSVYRCAVPE